MTQHAVVPAAVALAFVCATVAGLAMRKVSVRRSLDLIGATAALVLLLPLLLAIAVAIKATSKGPLLVRQRQYGKDGRAFTTYVFRTRVWTGSANHIAAQITPVGRLLRMCGLDRLPQLIRVFSGKASQVGLQDTPDRTARRDGRF